LKTPIFEVCFDFLFPI